MSHSKWQGGRSWSSIAIHDLPSRVGHRHDPLQRGPLGRRRRGHHARGHGQSVLHSHAMGCWNGKNAEQSARQGSVSYCRRSTKSAKRLQNAPRRPPVVSPAICHVAPRARQGRRLRPPLGTMRVSVSRVSSAFISIRWAQGSIVSCVSGDIQASRATFPSQGHERAPPDRLRPRACPSAWALVDVWAWMAAGQNAHGARWIATYQAAEIVATEALQRRRRRLRESEALLTLHHPIGGC